MVDLWRGVRGNQVIADGYRAAGGVWHDSAIAGSEQAQGDVLVFPKTANPDGLRAQQLLARVVPKWHFVGLAQYARLFYNDRWLLSLENLALYGVLFVLACLGTGSLLAVLIDRQVAGEGDARTGERL
jgi:ABC-type sugar transport system permease subunit